MLGAPESRSQRVGGRIPTRGLAARECHRRARRPQGRSGFALGEQSSRGVSCVSSVPMLCEGRFLRARTGAAVSVGLFAGWGYAHVPSAHGCASADLWAQAKNCVLVSTCDFSQGCVVIGQGGTALN